MEGVQLGSNSCLARERERGGKRAARQAAQVAGDPQVWRADNNCIAIGKWLIPALAPLLLSMRRGS